MEVKVLITGCGGGSVGQQILKALRLSDYKYHIIGTDIKQLSKGAKTADTFVIVPRADDIDYIETIFNICRENKVSAIFPGSEAELVILSKNKDIFINSGIHIFANDMSLIDVCMDKAKTVEFLRNHGFKYPKTIEITKLEDFDNSIEFPIVLKPSTQSGGSMNVMVAQNLSELKLFATYLLNIYSKFIIQEYIGSPNEEYTVGLLYDNDYNFVNSICLKRDLSGGLNQRLKVPNNTPNETLGSHLVISSGISQGEISEFKDVREVCEKIGQKLSPKCAINVQCRKQNDEIYVFEINPRFSGTTSLRAMVGYNEPDVLIRKHILQENIETNFTYSNAQIVRGLDEHIFKF